MVKIDYAKPSVTEYGSLVDLTQWGWAMGDSGNQRYRKRPGRGPIKKRPPRRRPKKRWDW